MPRTNAYRAEEATIYPAYKLGNAQTSSRENVELFDAAKRGDLRSLRSALSAGGNPNYYKHPEEGATALLAASATGHADVIRTLLEAGAAVGERLITNHNGPLHIAAAAGHLEAVELLLRAGALINTGNAFGNSPLMAALVTGHKKVVSLLLERGADVTWTNNKLSTPLHFSCYSSGVSEADQRDLATALLDAGAVVNAQDEDGMTPLMVAAREGFADLTRLFLARGAKRGLEDAQGKDAAFWAKFRGHEAVVQLLRGS